MYIPTQPPPKVNPQNLALLEAAVTRSGLSARAFAERLLSRDLRTVRRWRSGELEIPQTTVNWLARYLQDASPLRPAAQDPHILTILLAAMVHPTDWDALASDDTAMCIRVDTARRWAAAIDRGVAAERNVDDQQG